MTFTHVILTEIGRCRIVCRKNTLKRYIIFRCEIHEITAHIAEDDFSSSSKRPVERTEDEQSDSDMNICIIYILIHTN